jgi:hypothetical protein
LAVLQFSQEISFLQALNRALLIAMIPKRGKMKRFMQMRLCGNARLHHLVVKFFGWFPVCGFVVVHRLRMLFFLAG